MTSMTRTPSSDAHFHSLESQVGGHPGVMASEDGSLIVKPCLPSERNFYELLAQEDQRLVHIQPFVPKFYGTLKLHGEVKKEANLNEVEGIAALNGSTGIEQGNIPPPDVQDKDELLENISSYFTKPNVLDIKLGTILYDDSASQEKKERMIKAAEATTSLETGIRMTGFEVYDYSKREAVITHKDYGKALKPSELPEAMRRFFPLSTSPSDKPEGQGLPSYLLLSILKGLLNDVQKIRQAITVTEIRMVGGSLLVAYEADWEKTKAGLERIASAKMASNEALDDGDGNDEDDETIIDGSDSEADEDGPPYTARLIDFAHTRLTPGDGPDNGVLKGLDTVIELLEGRIKEVESGGEH